MTQIIPLPYPIRQVLIQKIEQNYLDKDGDNITVNEAWYEASRLNEKQICVWPEYADVKQLTLDGSGSDIGGIESYQVQLFAPDENTLHTMYREVKSIITDHSKSIDPTYDNLNENEFNQTTGVEHFYIWREERFHKDKKRNEEAWRHVFWVHAKYNEPRS